MIKTHDIYKPLYTDTTHPIILVTGGRASGKSYGIGAFIERLTFEKKLQDDGASLAHQILYTRYTMVSAAISIIPEFLEKIELDGTERYFAHTRTDVENVMTGSRIMFRGIKSSSGNQTAKLKSIHGITTFVVDEAEEWTSEKDFETIFYSIRQKGIQNRVIIIMNPTDSYHWVYQRFIKNTHRIVDYDGFPVQISTHPQVLHIHTSFLDNIQNLSEEFIKSARLTKETDPAKYAHLFMGQWADVAEGAVFKNVGEVKEFPTYADKLAIGLDFGFANDPSAAVLCGVYDDQLYMKELFYARGMKAKDIADALRPYDLPVYADSADPRLIDDIHLQGVNIYPVQKGAGSILAGIDKMKSMQLLVTSDSHNLLNEFHNYVWDKDKDGNYINRPVDRENHCFTADTLVATPQGAKPIAEIREGDLVLTSHGTRKVTKFFDNGERKIIKVRLSFGGEVATLEATPEHNIKTSAGWKRLDQLKCGDVLFLLNSSTERSTTNIKANAITPKGAIVCIASCGRSTMAKFRKVATCIISTATPKTTRPKTSSLLTASCTNTCTQRSTRSKTDTSKEQKKQWPTPVSLQINGTPQKRDVSGIRSTPVKSPQTLHLLHSLASGVARNMKQRNWGVTTIAATNAKPQHATTAGLTMKSEFAPRAEKLLLSTNIHEQNIAVANVVQNVEVLSISTAHVYDIEVEEAHEFFANGVLVHNCIDASRYYTLYRLLGHHY